MDIIRKISIWLGDFAFGLLAPFSPVVALWIISAVTGVLMLLIWRYTSNQSAIADVRRKISAHLLSTRLFKDDLSVTFRAQRQIIWQAVRLLGHSVQPMLIMMVPFVLVMVQIGLRYEYRPAIQGQAVRVKATLKKPDAVLAAGSVLQLPGSLRMDPHDPCRVSALATVDWRLTPTSSGVFLLHFGNGADVVSMPLVVGSAFTRVSRFRGGSFWDRLLYSGEDSIPDSSIFKSIEIFYPTRSTPIFGWDLHWLISLLILSIVFALIFKPMLKVHI
ncbi:MAG TPA: hypothetical protein VJZ71_07210 [Phycisphaerae bacterium]|nr:hypothetical protein [Phycisphaerae bacterium]